MIPKILISAPSSSCGKTTIVCALSKILKEKYPSKVCVFKIGPDYIDPLFHSKIIGTKTGNLDLFFNNENELKSLFEQNTSESDFAIIEGAMGFFDGISNSEKASAFDVANVLDCSTILVIDAKGKSLSICAEINGFLNFRKSSKIVGVILNRCSKSLYDLLSPKIKEECKIETFGFLENNSDFAIESRHLGLVTPDAVKNLQSKIEKISESAKNTISIEKIIEVAQKFSSKQEKVIKKEPINPIVKIAVANDEAFCFYYKENFDLLKNFGAELCFFSPLKNESIPSDCSALYIGGGYPELFFEKLLDNTLSSASIKQFARSGAPIFAECGGFLYLQMLGILKGSFENKGKLVRFGYVEIESKEDNFLFKKGEKIKGHEFHYFDTTENGDSFIATKTNGKSWDCIQVASYSDFAPNAFEKNIIAGFPHFYFPSNPKVAERFVDSALFFESMKSVESSCSGCGGCSSKSKENNPRCANCSGCKNQN